MNAWELVENEFNCQHHKTEIRHKDASNGQRMYKLQCLNCGAGVGQFIKHADIPSPALIQPFDDRLTETYNCLKRDRYNDLTTDRQDDFWQKYNNYLQSPIWHNRRARVLRRDNYRCKACLNDTATQVHHKTYDHVFNEPLFDLESVCDDCHKALTAMDREKRNGQR